MKIHIYKGPMDKIPLNAVPFYKDDKAEYIEEVMDLIKRGEPAIKYYDISTFGKANFGDHTEAMLNYFKEYCGEEIAKLMEKHLKEGTLYFIDNSFDDADRHLWLFTGVDKDYGNTVIVYNMYKDRTSVYTPLRGFVKQLNEKFKELGFTDIIYYFPVAHAPKPNLSKDEYDRVLRVGATEDFMGYRMYMKKLV